MKENELSTAKRVEQYYGLVALLDTWEKQPDAVQVRFHDDIIRLRARVRTIRNYILNRADPSANIFE